MIPAAYMTYTDLETLRGLWFGAEYGSGLEFGDGLLSLQGNNHNGDSNDTDCEGGYDSTVKEGSVGLQVRVMYLFVVSFLRNCIRIYVCHFSIWSFKIYVHLMYLDCS